MFEFNDIFVPVIFEYLQPIEAVIVKTFCGIWNDTDITLQQAMEYCITHDIQHYFATFVNQVKPEQLLQAGAAFRNHDLVDLAIIRGAQNFTTAMIYSVRTNDMKWIMTFARETIRYALVIAEAMRFNNAELIRQLWSLSTESGWIVGQLHCCRDPIGMLKCDELKVDIAHVTRLGDWPHSVQIQVVNDLMARGYKNPIWLVPSLVQYGNIAGLYALEQYTELDYEDVLHNAVRYGQTDIMRIARHYGRLSIEQITYALQDNIEEATVDAVKLLLSWGANVRHVNISSDVGDEIRALLQIKYTVVDDAIDPKLLKSKLEF